MKILFQKSIIKNSKNLLRNIYRIDNAKSKITIFKF